MKIAVSQPRTSHWCDSDSFDEYVRRYYRLAYNIAYRMSGNHADAEDITQEAFIRAYRFLDRYDPSLPFENWLYRIIANVFIDDVRRRPKVKLQSLDQTVTARSTAGEVHLELPDDSTNPETMMMQAALDEPLQRALESLPRDFRHAVILADIEGLSYEEIAAVMGCSLGTVRSRLHRGRKLMRNRLLAENYLPSGRLGGEK